MSDFFYKNNEWEKIKICKKDKYYPKDWNHVYFKDMIEMLPNSKKYQIPASEIKKSGSVPVLTQENDFISGYSDNLLKLKKFDKEYILFGDHTTNFKHICFDFMLGGDGTQVFSTKINTKFFYYLCINNIIQPTGYNRHFKDLKEKIIFIPKSDKEINSIAEILTNQEELIKKDNFLMRNILKNIAYYQQYLLSGKTRIKLSVEKEKELLSKGVISLVEEKTEKEQFSFFNINDGKVEEFVSLVDLTKDIVFYQNDEANWKTEEVNELQKQLPKDWNLEQLYKKVNFIKGKSIPENQLNYNGEGVKYLKTTEFWLDSSSKRDTVHYTGKVEEKYMKKKDEYVFSMDGFNNKIGQGTLGLISNEDEGIVSTSFYKLEKNDIYHLVVNVLKSNYVQNFIMRLGEGTTVYHAGKYMKNLQGVFPKSTVEQKLLSMIFEKEEKLVDSLKEKIKLEEKVFKYLQQELLSGRIRIKVEE